MGKLAKKGQNFGWVMHMDFEVTKDGGRNLNVKEDWIKGYCSQGMKEKCLGNEDEIFRISLLQDEVYFFLSNLDAFSFFFLSACYG